MTTDEARSTRLLFDRELSHGTLTSVALDSPELRRAVSSRRVPGTGRRYLERLASRVGVLAYERSCAEALAAARRSALGLAADGPPRLLVRVDEFPHARSFDEPERYGPDEFERFHAVMRDAAVPYLLAVTPRLARDYLSPRASGGRGLDGRERALLGRLHSEGVALGLHGLDHRTRRRGVRRRSELAGLTGDGLSALLDRATAELAAAGLAARVFVPPFNRFAADQYDRLARRYDVVCGGPESVATMGFHLTPLWRGDAVYMPAYAPLYGRAAEIELAVRRLAARRAALWVPVVLHWGWELTDGLAGLRRLVRALAELAVPWTDFLDAVGRSRGL